jgi:hypothetical protein
MPGKPAFPSSPARRRVRSGEGRRDEMGAVPRDRARQAAGALQQHPFRVSALRAGPRAGGACLAAVGRSPRAAGRAPRRSGRSRAPTRSPAGLGGRDPSASAPGWPGQPVAQPRRLSGVLTKPALLAGSLSPQPVEYVGAIAVLIIARCRRFSEVGTVPALSARRECERRTRSLRRVYPARQARGRMFWFIRNRLPGS